MTNHLLFRNRDKVAGGIYGLLNIILFTYRYYQFEDDAIKLARGSAAVIYFNFVLLILNVMQVTISRIRYWSITKWILLDRHIDVHKIAGNAIFLFSLIHVYAYWRKYNNNELIFDSTILTGITIMACFIPLWLFAQLPFRNSKRFELFYYTHYLLFPIIILLYYHAPQFLMFTSIPIIGYSLDRAYRFWCTFYPGQLTKTDIFEHDRTIVIKLEVYSKSFMSRPGRTKYRSGDIIYLCFPDISKWQWHPFSISSSPYESGYITVHVKVAGDWTIKLLELCRKVSPEQGHRVNPLVYFDGPLGSPNSSMHDHKHVVLVGQGIGATPYVSLLKYLLDKPITNKIKEVDFFWVGQDENIFKWAEDTTKRTFSINPLRGRLEKEMADQGVKVNIYQLTGKVDWMEQFSKIDKTISPVVYVCGTWALAEQIGTACDKYQFVFKKENY